MVQIGGLRRHVCQVSGPSKKTEDTNVNQWTWGNPSYERCNLDGADRSGGLGHEAGENSKSPPRSARQSNTDDPGQIWGGKGGSGRKLVTCLQLSSSQRHQKSDRHPSST